MIGNLAELNFIVLIASFMLGIVLIPVLKNTASFIPRTTSILTTSSIYLFAFVFFDENLILGAIVELFCAIIWTLIIIFRGHKV